MEEVCTIFSQYWICVPSQLQHSCLNSTPALLLFLCRRGGGVGGEGGLSQHCVSKASCPIGLCFTGTVPPLVFKSTEQEWHRLLELLLLIICKKKTLITFSILEQSSGLLSLFWSVKFSRPSLSCERERKVERPLQDQRCHTFTQPSSIFNQPSFDVYSWATP